MGEKINSSGFEQKSVNDVDVNEFGDVTAKWLQENASEITKLDASQVLLLLQKINSAEFESERLEIDLESIIRIFAQTHVVASQLDQDIDNDKAIYSKLENEYKAFNLSVDWLNKHSDEISNLTRGMFLHFLMQLKNNEKFKENSQAIDQKTVSKILKKGWQIARETPEETKGFYNRSMILSELGYALTESIRSFDKKSISDTAVVAFQDAYQSDPEMATRYWQTFLQKSQTVHPDVLVGVIKDMNADPRVQNDWRQTTVGELMGRLSETGVYNKSMQQEIRSDIAKGNTYGLLKWFYLLRLVRDRGVTEDWSQPAAYEAQEQLQLISHSLSETPVLQQFVDKKISQSGLLVEKDIVVSPELTAHYELGEMTHITDKKGNDLDLYKLLALSDQKNNENKDFEKALLDFKILSDFDLRELIDKQLGISLSSLDMRLQMRLINTLAKLNENELGLTKKLIEKNQDLIDLAYLGEFGKEGFTKVLLLIDSLPDAESGKLQSLFKNILQVIRKKDEELSKEFFQDSITVSPMKEVLRRVVMLVDKYSSLTTDDSEYGLSNLQKELSTISPDMEILAAVFKQAVRENKANLAYVKEMIPGSYYASVLTEKQRQDYLDLFDNEYKKEPYWEEERKKVEEQLDKDAKTEWVEVRWKGELVGLMRFDDIDDYTQKIASLIIGKSLRSAGLSTIMRREYWDEHAKEKVLIGEAEMRREVTSDYVESDFIIDAVIEDVNNGIHLWQIVRNDKTNLTYDSRQDLVDARKETDYEIRRDMVEASRQKIVEQYLPLAQQLCQQKKWSELPEQFTLRFEVVGSRQPSNSDLEIFKQLLHQQNYVISRMFEKQGVMYYVMEKAND